jgi:hypothetical protein
MMTSKINFLKYKSYSLMNVIVEFINNNVHRLTKAIINDVYYLIDKFILYFKLEKKNIDFSITTKNGTDLLLEFKNTITKDIFNMKISKLIRLMKLEELNNTIILKDSDFVELKFEIKNDNKL